MRNSLIFKLMGAFLLVIAIGGLLISFLTSRATQNAFTLYTTRSGQAWAQRLAPVLADFYVQNGSWNGVDQLLQSGLSSTAMGSGMGGMMGGNGRGYGPGGPASNGMMTGMVGQRLVLADAQGLVVSDTLGELEGQPLPANELSLGEPVQVGDRQVGTILVTPYGLSEQGTPANEFLNSVNLSILTSVLIAAGLAMILGAGLFIQITRPLRRLQQAAGAIASGKLDQRVNIASRDELGQLGQTFNRMAESLERAQDQRRRLVADVAHELRTPLAVIQANAEGMLDGVLPMDSDQVNAIYNETLLLNRLVSDLRLLSLAEAGELRLERQPVEPGQLVRQAVERLQPQAAQRGISLSADIQAGLPERSLDSDRITQVLNNLIANALRYTPQGGFIRVEATPTPGGRVRIAITDNGTGIPPEDLTHIFDRFYRADKSRTRASGGSGLGLAIVKQLVDAHDGQVAVESPVQTLPDGTKTGTRFTITL